MDAKLPCWLKKTSLAFLPLAMLKESAFLCSYDEDADMLMYLQVMQGNG